jgi:aminomethyltransferase
MVPFAGWDMPIEYKGIVEEHNAVRNAVGVFDVSHMGEVSISGPEALKFVNHIFTNDVAALADGGVVYGMMLYDNGTTVDDLLVYRRKEDDFFLVINAGNIDKDVAWIKQQASGYDVVVTDLSDCYSELAVQGPLAEKTLLDVLGIDVSTLGFFTFRDIVVNVDAQDPETGYTGEDGFEIYASPETIIEMWQKLMAANVQPCGLGCRDTLRFEAGLPLYGDELDEETTPIEAGLSMFVHLDKPEFIGREVCAEQKANGAPKKLVGLEIQGPAIARHGYEVLDAEENVIGHVTTGYRSITLDKNIATAFVQPQFAKLGTELKVRVRRKVFPAVVIKKRFYTPNYKK